ncbi:MAG: class II fructose-bisphosphatase [Rhodospirillales bacterium]|nr:class II fructose-bisphosphatase [Rhodospirillales bacterium]
MAWDTFLESLLIYALRRATEGAARAAYEWLGRGEKSLSDRAAMNAMRCELDRLPIGGVVVIGDASLDEKASLKTGQRIGKLDADLQFDIAVDPVEGTSYLARGLTNAMAVMALAPKGTLYQPGPAFYMEKFVAPPAAKGKIDPKAPVEEKLRTLAGILKKPVSELNIFVLEKPRHNELIDRIHGLGARVALYPAGDVGGALMASIPDSGIDALVGTGGTPEGILSACAIRTLGGEMQARLDPQLPSEVAAVKKAGLDTARWLAAEDLVRSEKVYFAATGITTGLLFEGVERVRGLDRTQTLLISGISGERQLLTTYHIAPDDAPTPRKGRENA